MGYKTNDVINGSYGYVWVGQDLLAQVIGFEAKMKLEKADVIQTGTLAKGQKVIGVEGTGTIKMNKIDSYFINLLLDDIQNGKAPTVTIISNLDDPAAKGNERIKLSGVTFDEITIADWEGKKLGEESIPFTFERADKIDTIA